LKHIVKEHALINCKIFSLPFDDENCQFDQQELGEFLDTHNTVSIQAQFFTYLDKPYYGVVVLYEDVTVPATFA